MTTVALFWLDPRKGPSDAKLRVIVNPDEKVTTLCAAYVQLLQIV
ncbi:hypothetical protein [Rathayibacter sp. AY1F6]|nr:hypothetical protein [Rathayibacter sp. AY1F6]